MLPFFSKNGYNWKCKGTTLTPSDYQQERKKMKKIATILLTLCLIFALASCKSECEKKGHVDENSDGYCDVCSELHTEHTDLNSDGYCDGCKSLILDYNKPSAVAQVLKNKLENQIQSVNSFHATIEVDVSETEENWKYSTTNEPYLDTNIYGSKVKIDFTISITETSLNAKVEYFQTYSRSHPNYDSYSTSEDEETFYLIDGIWYSQVQDNYYEANSLATPELEGLLNQIQNIQLLSAEDKEKVTQALSKEFVTVFNIRDNKGSVGIDLKPKYDEVKSYFASLDLKTQTIGMLLDDVLVQLHPNLNTENILNKVVSVGNLTLIEAYDEIDAWLTEEYQTNFQAIYEMVAKNPDVINAIRYFVIENNELDEDDEDEMAELDEAIALFSNFNLREFLSESDIKDETVYTLISGMEFIDFDFPATPEEFANQLRSILSLTLAEFDENTETYFFRSMKEGIASIEFNALNALVDVNFKNLLEIDTIVATMNIDFKRYLSSDEVEGKTDTLLGKLNVRFTISNLSTEKVDIALPSTIQSIPDDFFEHSYSTTLENYEISLNVGHLYPYSNGKLFSNNISIFNPATSQQIVVLFNETPFERAYDEIFTLDASEIQSVYGGTLTLEEGTKFQFIIHHDSDTIEIVSFPAFAFPTA